MRRVAVLQGRLTISVYESLNAQMTLEPHVLGKSGIEGHVAFEGNIDPDIYSGSYAFDADYRLTTAELKTGLDVYLFADFTTFDHTWFAWPKGSVASDYKTHFPIKLAERTLARLPQLTGAVDMAAVNPANIGAIKVVGAQSGKGDMVLRGRLRAA